MQRDVNDGAISVTPPTNVRAIREPRYRGARKQHSTGMGNINIKQKCSGKALTRSQLTQTASPYFSRNSALLHPVPSTSMLGSRRGGPSHERKWPQDLKFEVLKCQQPMWKLLHCWPIAITYLPKIYIRCDGHQREARLITSTSVNQGGRLRRQMIKDLVK